MFMFSCILPSSYQVIGFFSKACLFFFGRENLRFLQNCYFVRGSWLTAVILVNLYGLENNGYYAMTRS